MSKLAQNGGSPLRTTLFQSWPIYNEKESQALDRVLKSGVWGTLGSEVKKFTQRFAEYQECKYGVAVNNGTVSLEVILRALNIGYGDEVIVPPYTFNATVSAVIIVGATPVFADIESNTYNIDPESIEKVITPRTKAIIPVHIGGRMANMDRIMEIATKHGLSVIEDAAHAPGSEWKGKRAGSIGHAGSFSFQGSKNLCSGEGGFITSNDQEIYEQCWSIHHCGRASRGTVWYEHPIIGTNARMTEWQAAILDAQMDRLDVQIDLRMKNAEYLNAKLSETGFIEVFPQDDRVTRNSYHLYLFKFISRKCKGLSREIFCKALNAEGIPCSIGYRCLYKQEVLMTDAMKKMTGSSFAYDKLYLPNTDKAADKEGMWFTHTMLLGDRKDVDDIFNAMMKIYENADELLRID